MWQTLETPLSMLPALESRLTLPSLLPALESRLTLPSLKSPLTPSLIFKPPVAMPATMPFLETFMRCECIMLLNTGSAITHVYSVKMYFGLRRLSSVTKKSSIDSVVGLTLVRFQSLLRICPYFQGPAFTKNMSASNVKKSEDLKNPVLVQTSDHKLRSTQAEDTEPD
uniref:Putative ovule protein n=1 Tax=Solanum chacoense TaxID=4108 RepID=A0A0V0HB26_SOLCH